MVLIRGIRVRHEPVVVGGLELKQQQRTRELGDPHPHTPAHGGPIGYSWLVCGG